MPVRQPLMLKSVDRQRFRCAAENHLSGSATATWIDTNQLRDFTHSWWLLRRNPFVAHLRYPPPSVALLIGQRCRGSLKGGPVFLSSGFDILHFASLDSQPDARCRLSEKPAINGAGTIGRLTILQNLASTATNSKSSSHIANTSSSPRCFSMDPRNLLVNITVWTLYPTFNCTAAGAFAAHFRCPQRDEDSLLVKSLRDLIRSCSNTTIGNFTDGNAVDWYRQSDAIYSSAFDNFISNITYMCDREFCKNVEFAGNPDLAGIGIYSTYILLVILATVFIFIYGLQDVATIVEKRGRDSVPKQRLQAVAAFFAVYWKPPDSSLETFWVSSFYFVAQLLLHLLFILIA